MLKRRTLLINICSGIVTYSSTLFTGLLNNYPSKSSNFKIKRIVDFPYPMSEKIYLEITGCWFDYNAIENYSFEQMKSGGLLSSETIYHETGLTTYFEFKSEDDFGIWKDTVHNNFVTIEHYIKTGFRSRWEA